MVKKVRFYRKRTLTTILLNNRMLIQHSKFFQPGVQNDIAQIQVEKDVLMP